MELLAIDPGELHTGVARGQWDPVMARMDWVDCTQWEGIEASALGLEALLKAKNGRVTPIEEVIIEDFVLYSGKRGPQSFQPMLTSELIGALKHICHGYEVPHIMQGASIKKPMRRQLAARGIRQNGRGTHQRDAELHLYHRAFTAHRTPVEEDTDS